jgi:ABC-2 type transport system permease protein
LSVTGPGVGRVYDRGYRPYDGELGGRSAARLALLRASVRRALGIRRSWRQKLFPWLLLAIASVPAIVNVGVAYLTRDRFTGGIEFITYREYVGVSTALLVFVGLTAPDVICPDRRNRTLPLIFSRPLTGADYVLAKVGAIAAIVFAFGLLPQVVLFVGQTLVSDAALDYLGDNAAVMWQVPIAVALLALYYASLAVAISSFATRRIVAAAALLILLLVTSITAGILSEPATHQAEIMVREGSAWAALNLLAAPLHVRDLVFEGEVISGRLAGAGGATMLAIGVYVAVVAASLGTLLWRYRWVET